jgi:hypothetical protein
MEPFITIYCRKESCHDDESDFDQGGINRSIIGCISPERVLGANSFIEKTSSTRSFHSAPFRAFHPNGSNLDISMKASFRGACEICDVPCTQN